MPISHTHKTIFVHIPKTAGTSVEAVLGMHGDRKEIGLVPYFNQEVDHEHLYGRQIQHMTAQDIRGALADQSVFTRYFKFTIVRNPWDRLVSALAWTDQKWAKGVELTMAEFDEQLRRTYELFVAAASGSTPVAMPQFLYPQVLFIADADGRLLVDFVGKYETLAADWKVISARLGLNTQLPVRMKSHHRDYRDYYSPQTRDLVAQMYAADLQAFGYEF